MATTTTISLQDRVAGLDDLLDTAMRDPEYKVDRQFLLHERDLIAVQEGCESGRITQRIRDLADMHVAALEADMPRLREEAGIVYEREIMDIHFAMDAEGNKCVIDNQDTTETVWAFDERQRMALLTFCGEIVATSVLGDHPQRQARSGHTQIDR